MKKILTSLALSVAFAASASAITFIDESFDGSLPADFPGAYSTTDLDGTGGSVSFTGTTVTGYTMLGGTYAQAVSAGSFSFSFYLDNNAGSANVSGGRVKFFSDLTNSSGGFGINFNYVQSTDTFTVFGMIGASQTNANALPAANQSISFTGAALVSGVVTFPTATTANMSLSVVNTAINTTIDFDSNVDISALVTGNRIVFRPQTGGYILDGITVSASAVPEPSSFAALAGLAALGFVASRRRRA